ncbi:Glutamine--fructose-6-phosphate aminotransferase [isomerizing] [Defluviimonas aquaemixtae]|uniref:Glutamine--fructose-6-phosphate aminotransferase [isomerizing] n=1 Tax=Albidovulum aquaemixtae TaxID=1542388 RepID=A0A2R8B5D0_9RHOB|nr:SIS domain-containing protein [Defluviimonas aquaemixtae]SPH17819.1 Glutamine--fructose-6-phosphate aminotransferase [isomerizing] [Defluviimonas aquaemixtae]
MTDVESLMRAEVREIPEAVQRLLDRGGAAIRDAARAARDLDPAFMATVARGSSDHACSYLKYAAELTLGLPVASIGPSVASIYRAPLRLGGSLCLSVSQSGRSPDIVELARVARASGALSVAVTNDAGSEVAQAADHVLDIQAGPELSVAATKTFVTSAVAGLALIAEWCGDTDLQNAINSLPGYLDNAAQTDWSALGTLLASAESLYTLGRGPGFAMSGEAALKFKETCQIHAENYSSAEVLHGPVSIVRHGFPVLAFAAADAAEDAVVEVADAIAGKGADVWVTSDRASVAHRLEPVRTDHHLTDSIALIVTFYAMVEGVARARGIDPDTPRHLRKVTETV